MTLKNLWNIKKARRAQSNKERKPQWMRCRLSTRQISPSTCSSLLTWTQKCELQTDHREPQSHSKHRVGGGAWRGQGSLELPLSTQHKGKSSHQRKLQREEGGGRLNGSAQEARSEWVWPGQGRGPRREKWTGKDNLRVLSLLKTPFSPLENEHPSKTCLCGRSLRSLALCGPCREQGFPCSENHRVLRSMWLSWCATPGDTSEGYCGQILAAGSP